MRHGRKSQHQRFYGYKLGVAADVDTRLVTAVAVVPGNAHDGTVAEPLVEAIERATRQKARETIGDSAFWGCWQSRRVAGAGRTGDGESAQAVAGWFLGKEQFEVGPDRQ